MAPTTVSSYVAGPDARSGLMILPRQRLVCLWSGGRPRHLPVQPDELRPRRAPKHEADEEIRTKRWSVNRPLRTVSAPVRLPRHHRGRAIRLRTDPAIRTSYMRRQRPLAGPARDAGECGSGCSLVTSQPNFHGSSDSTQATRLGPVKGRSAWTRGPPLAVDRGQFHETPPARSASSGSDETSRSTRAPGGTRLRVGQADTVNGAVEREERRSVVVQRDGRRRQTPKSRQSVENSSGALIGTTPCATSSPSTFIWMSSGPAGLFSTYFVSTSILTLPCGKACPLRIFVRCTMKRLYS